MIGFFIKGRIDYKIGNVRADMHERVTCDSTYESNLR